MFSVMPVKGTLARQTMPEADRSLTRLSADSLLRLGTSLDNNLGKAFLCMSAIVSRYEAGGDCDAATAVRAYNNCGHILFHEFEQYSEAFSYFEKARVLAEKKRVKDMLPVVYLNLGNLYLTYANRRHDADETRMARDYYKKGFYAAEAIGHYELLTLNFINMLNIELDSVRPVAGSPEFRRFMALSIPDTIRGVRFAKGMARVVEAMSRGNYPRARQLLHANLAVIDARYSQERYEYAIYTVLAKIFREENRPDSAIYYLKRVENLADRYQLPDIRPDMYRELSELYAIKGEKALSDHYKMLWLQSQDSLLNINNLDGVGKAQYMSRLYDAGRKLTVMEKEKRTFVYIVSGGAILLVGILVVLVMMMRHHRQMKAKNRELYLKNRSLLAAEEAQEKRGRKERRDVEKRAKSSDESDEISDKQERVENKYSRSGLDEDTKDEICRKIKDVFAHPEYFCSPDFSIDRLAQLVGEKSKNVSQVVNERFGCTFSILLSDSRVKEACRRMDRNADYDRLTIEAISAEMGFRSRTTFLTAFKRVTGLTPSQYQRMAADNR